MSTWQEYLSQNRDRFINELLDFLRIPSISALSEHAGDVQKAAEWTAEAHTEMGHDGAVAGLVIAKRRGVADLIGECLRHDCRARHSMRSDHGGVDQDR